MNKPKNQNVNEIIKTFGGLRATARALNISASTVQGWKARQSIPEDRMIDIEKALSMPGSAQQKTVPANKNKPHKKAQTKQAVAVDSPVQPQPQPRLDTSIQSDLKNRALDAQNLENMKMDIVKRSVITTLIIVTVIGGVFWLLFMSGGKAPQNNQVTQNQNELGTQIGDIERQFKSFETTVMAGLNEMGERVTDIGAAVGVERNQNGDLILNQDMPLTQRMTALESRLRASGEEIDLGQMLSRFENQGDMDEAMKDLKSIVMMLQGRMDQLDTALIRARADNDALAKSLENVSSRDLSAAAMLLTLSQFRNSMNRQEAFADDLDVLRGMIGDDDPELVAAIDRLAPYADKGVLSPEGLGEELRTITGDIIVAKLSGEDVSISDRILTRLAQIVTLEKDGAPIIATKEDEIIARAQQALDNGDVQGALQALNQLEGHAAAAAQPFKQKAQGTLAAQNAQSQLIEAILNRLIKTSQQPDNVPVVTPSVSETTPSVDELFEALPDGLGESMGGGKIVQDPASGIIILE